jgi:hypothetical protein
MEFYSVRYVQNGAWTEATLVRGTYLGAYITAKRADGTATSFQVDFAGIEATVSDPVPAE